MEELFILMFFGFITLVGFVCGTIINKIVEKHPELEKYFFYED